MYQHVHQIIITHYQTQHQHHVNHVNNHVLPVLTHTYVYHVFQDINIQIISVQVHVQ